MLTLKHLRSIEAIHEHGSLTLAAARLHVTQSALSHQLLSLEKHYDLNLFERVRPMKLTPAGERLLKLSRTISPLLRDAEHDLNLFTNNHPTSRLRLAVECHTCYDWLMPAMDAYRTRWPDVEMDLVSGFHADPIALLEEDRADLVIVSEPENQRNAVSESLFRYEMLALMHSGHPLSNKKFLSAIDFANEILITYPAPDRLLDLVRRVLTPASIFPERRHAELTIAIVQLVASRKGLAALPAWAIVPYLERGYVVARPIGQLGLWSDLYATVRQHDAERPYIRDFVTLLREQVFMNLPGIKRIEANL